MIHEKFTKNIVLNYLPYLSLLHLGFYIHSQRLSSDGMLCNCGIIQLFYKETLEIIFDISRNYN